MLKAANQIRAPERPDESQEGRTGITPSQQVQEAGTAGKPFRGIKGQAPAHGRKEGDLDLQSGESDTISALLTLPLCLWPSVTNVSLVSPRIFDEMFYEILEILLVALD